MEHICFRRRREVHYWHSRVGIITGTVSEGDGVCGPGDMPAKWLGAVFRIIASVAKQHSEDSYIKVEQNLCL